MKLLSIYLFIYISLIIKDASSYFIRKSKNELFMKKDKDNEFGKFNKLSFEYTGKTVNQKIYVNELNNKNNTIIISVGPAGTGKTLLACSNAIENLKKKKIEKIIITRPVVTVEEEIGFLPGNMVKKMDPWTRPLFDIFSEYYSNSEINNMIINGQIEISPLGYMRGRTFKNSFIIADEMQNSSPNQMLMLLTRIGDNSKMVITGDLKQSDRKEDNGLHELINKIKNYKKYNNVEEIDKIKLVELNNTDIQRSETVEAILKIYNYENLNESVNNTIIKINNTNNTTNNTNTTNTNNTKTNTNNTGINYINKHGSSDCAIIPKKYCNDLFFYTP